MAAFDNNKQRMVGLTGARLEVGGGVTISGVSGQTFTIATKLRRVIMGHGVMDTDGMTARATPGVVSGGLVTFRRYAAIETSADTISYTLIGY